MLRLTSTWHFVESRWNLVNTAFQYLPDYCNMVVLWWVTKNVTHHLEVVNGQNVHLPLSHNGESLVGGHFDQLILGAPFSLHGFPAPFRRRFPALPLGGHCRVSHADGHAVFKVRCWFGNKKIATQQPEPDHPFRDSLGSGSLCSDKKVKNLLRLLWEPSWNSK